MRLGPGDLLLLDRDGVLNEDRADSVRTPGELVMLPRAAAAVARFNGAAVRVALVSNQSVVGRGLIDDAMLERIHDKLLNELAREGARLDAALYCPDAPWAATPRRKPGPGMLHEAIHRFGADPDRTVMVGDAVTDLQAAVAAGCRRALVRSGKGRDAQAAGLPPEVLPVAVYEDLWRAADALLETSA
ncbi:MAG: HAD-IIIA family hydrolase [Alphaproteobacteria bacterium]|nr:HAD-IIIA family hydrolase [Alphaproteobacteria bacterium]